MKLSIVSPVYKAEGIISELVRRINAAVGKITDDYEIILVEDGSPDNSWNEMVLESEKDQRVKSVKLSRNFGQHYAITAGLDLAIGEWLVVMDCDLQDRPEEISNFYKKALEGYDIVMGKRIIRNDKFIKRFTSNLFYLLFNYLTGIKHDNSIANFGIYSKKSIESIKSLRETGRSFSLLARWVGYPRYFMNIEHDERFIGSSSYSWSRLLKLATDSVVSFSDRPLRICVNFGISISLLSFFATLYILIKYAFNGIDVPGYTSIILSLWFLGGVILFFLGITGLYISKIFDNVKNRPLYIIHQTINI
jgi:glycosyltransferase involved in cell wall biosynthesis